MNGTWYARLGFSHYPVASFAETIQVPITICHIFAKKCVNDKRGHFVLIRSSAAYASLWGGSSTREIQISYQKLQ